MIKKTGFFVPTHQKCGRQKYKRQTVLLLLCAASISLSACDYVNSKLYPDFKANAVKSPVDKPPFERNISIEKVRDGDAERPIKVAAANMDKIKDVSSMTEPVMTSRTEKSIPQQMKMAEVKGLNAIPPADVTDNSFQDRLSKLERDVQSMQDAIRKMAPAITKIVNVETKVDSLSAQLEQLIANNKKMAMTQNAPQPKPKPQAEKPAPKPKPQQAKATSAPAPKPKAEPIPTLDGSDGTIQKMRIGDHASKTRIVFETSSKLDYFVSIDNEENLMNIVFPQSNVKFEPNKFAKASSLIRVIQAGDVSNKTIFAFDMAKATSVLSEERIGPSKATPNHRIVIDLKK